MRSAEYLLGRRPSPRSARWLIGQAVPRPQSTLFPLRLAADGSVLLRAFYKVHHVPETLSDEDAATRLASYRRVLTHGPAMEQRFRERAADLPITVPATLAVDLERLTEVQVALPGRAMSRSVLHDVPGRRRHARVAYRRLGQALAIIESFDAPVPAKPRGMVDEKTLRRLEPRLSGRHLNRLTLLLEELEREVEVTAAQVCAHGDLHGAHILWTGRTLGLIDLLWGSRWQGQDVAEQSARLHNELLNRKQWANTLIREMLIGYGDTDLPSSPQWRLSQLSHVARAAASTRQGKVDDHRRRQALRRLSNYLV